MTSLDDILQSCQKRGGSTDHCHLYGILRIILIIWNFFLGSLPIIFITADIWRAFKKRKHWIPPVSLVLSSFSLQLLMVLNNSLGLQFSMADVLGGRVSVCVFMGYLLPAVASPLSPNMWSDMMALIVSTSIPLFEIANDIYSPRILYDDFYATASFRLIMRWNVIMLVSIILLLLLLSCATVASVGIHQIVCRKTPISLSPQKFTHQFSWEKVEEHIIYSAFVVRSSSPQCILTRSVLTSPIAIITVICIGVLIQASLVDNVHFWVIILLDPFIMLGSGVIFWRCITATVHYPRRLSWKWSSVRQYFKLENFWVCYLQELEGKSLRFEQKGRSCFKKFMKKLWRGMVLNRSLRMLIWIQTFLVLFSKACWLVLQVLLSNKYIERLFMLSASKEFSQINGENDQAGIGIGEAPGFDKYRKALLQLPGECPAGIWIANRKSIEYIKKQMKNGEEDGKICNELMWLLKHKSSADFHGERHAKPYQNYRAMELEVERDLDVCKPSFKMAVVSLVTLMAQLASFIPSTDHNNLINKAIEACSQAWNIMDIVDNSDSESLLSTSADKLFQDLKKSRRWLGYHLPLRKSVGQSVKARIQIIVEKAKRIAMDYESRKCEEVAAGYRLYWLSVNLNFQHLTSVEETVDEMCRVLADVLASCTVKVVGVAMTDCKKWASMYEEEKIMKAVHIVGKVKNLMENVGWQLKWSFSSDAQSVETSIERARNSGVRNGRLSISLRKRITINIPRTLRFKRDR